MSAGSFRLVGGDVGREQRSPGGVLALAAPLFREFVTAEWPGFVITAAAVVFAEDPTTALGNGLLCAAVAGAGELSPAAGTATFASSAPAPLLGDGRGA